MTSLTGKPRTRWWRREEVLSKTVMKHKTTTVSYSNVLKPLINIRWEIPCELKWGVSFFSRFYVFFLTPFFKCSYRKRVKRDDNFLSFSFPFRFFKMRQDVNSAFGRISLRTECDTNKCMVDIYRVTAGCGHCIFAVSLYMLYCLLCLIPSTARRACKSGKRKRIFWNFLHEYKCTRGRTSQRHCSPKSTLVVAYGSEKAGNIFSVCVSIIVARLMCRST